MKKHPFALYAVWVAILAILPLPLVYLLNTNLVAGTRDLVIYDFGITAYVWWLAIIYLSTRPKWLDRLIGLPAMYFVHGMVGVLAVVLAFVHQLLAYTYHDEIRLTGDVAFYLAVFGIIYASIFMSGWFVDRFPVARITKEKLQVFFKHQLSVWIHRLNFVVVALIWLHVHLIPRVANITSFIIVFNVYTLVSLGTYAYRKFVSSYDERSTGMLVENKALSDNVRSVSIKFDNEQNYRPGDFYFIRFSAKGVSSEVHPFSVASSPLDDKHTIRFIIQSVGDYTADIKNVPIGTKVFVEGPFGRFDAIANENSQAPLVLYGLGSGVSPLYSMALAYAKTGRQVHLIWSAKNENEMYLDSEFTRLADSNSHVRYDGKAHRFTQEDLHSVISQQEMDSAQFFIVGSAPVVIRVRSQLNAMGIPQARLYDERLTM
ncbi:iron reductase [Alloscardovia theropitheci]|uniref:Iron reductase n=1 Tax=Alloscardovia theropitheci TaxID=2496842 RepID=A0A4R0QN86_9BIFI|nr:FAD-binding oxidoreductase [Alloscardovia theropitheci]TCD53614.1 iron reductase [Alloscardovia theropitheci]